MRPDSDAQDSNLLDAADEGCEPRKSFSYAHYRDILKAIAATHRTLTFADVLKLGNAISDVARYVIMRHDVEISLEAAEQMALIDNRNCVSSTFFLLQSGPYNCFEEPGARAIRNILRLGHDIGLHYDGGLFERLDLDPVRIVQMQIGVFETFFSTKVSAISAHMPTRCAPPVSIPGVLNAYAPAYFADIKYLSDSLQIWREGDIPGLLPRYDRIQLLTHECNWSEEGHSWDDIMLHVARARFRRETAEAEQSIATFRSRLASRAERDAQFRARILADG